MNLIILLCRLCFLFRLFRHLPEILRPNWSIIPLRSKKSTTVQNEDHPVHITKWYLSMSDCHCLCFQKAIHSAGFCPEFSDSAPFQQSLSSHKSIDSTLHTRNQTWASQMDLHPAHLFPGFYFYEATVISFFSFLILIYIRHKALVFCQTRTSRICSSLMYMSFQLPIYPSYFPPMIRLSVHCAYAA